MHSILFGFLLCLPLVSSVALYEQCGGEGYTGATSCNWPLQCFRRTRWFSACQVSCPGLDWECAGANATTIAPGPSALAQAWGQCGGEGWTGPTTCAQYPCYPRSRWYSQCRPDCPADRISSRMCSENPRAASFESASRRLSSAVNRPVWFHRIDSDQHRKSIQNELFSSASQEKQMTIIRCRSLLSKIVRIDQINKPLE